MLICPFFRVRFAARECLLCLQKSGYDFAGQTVLSPEFASGVVPAQLGTERTSDAILHRETHKTVTARALFGKMLRSEDQVISKLNAS